MSKNFHNPRIMGLPCYSRHVKASSAKGEAWLEFMLHPAAALRSAHIEWLGKSQLVAASNEVVLSQVVLAGYGRARGRLHVP